MPDNTILALFGRKGSGKSTLAKEITEDFDRVVVLDSMGEYGGDRREGFIILEGLSQTANLLPGYWRSGRPFRVSVRVLSISEALAVLTILWEMPGILVVMEETSLYCSPSTIPEELAMLVRYGRHRSISLLFVARRPSEIHRDLTAQCDLVIAFRQHEQRDVMYLRSILGDEAERLRHLPLYHVAVYGDMAKAPLAVLERLERQGQKTALDEPEPPEDSEAASP